MTSAVLGSVHRAHLYIPVDSALSTGSARALQGGTLTLAWGRLFHWHLDLVLVSRRCYKATRLLGLSG